MKCRFTAEEFAEIQEREYKEETQELKEKLGIISLETRMQILENEWVKLKVKLESGEAAK